MIPQAEPPSTSQDRTPPHLLERAAKLKLLQASPELPPEITPESEAAAERGEAVKPSDLVHRVLSHNTEPLEKVTITHPSVGKFTYMTREFQINDYAIAFFVDKAASAWEPPFQFEAILNFRQKNYTVVYAGGFFTFPTLPFVLVSFLRDNETKPE
jgi:hypothetical protein